MDLLHDNQGTYHNPLNGLVPYTGLVNYTTSLGTINNTYMCNGLATTTLNAGNNPGAATITSKIDNTTTNTVVTINASPAPIASFTANPTSGAAPLKVNFTDTSTGTITSYNWNFGDGTGTSTTQNPSYTYNNPGNYTVTLTITGPGGNSTTSQIITVNTPLVTIYRNGIPVAGYMTIKDAIQAAQSGDTIMLKDGTTFYESGFIINENLIFTVLNNGYATIDGQQTGPIFTINPGATVTIQKITITNGQATDGGAIRNEGTLIIQNCTFTSNTATNYGGAIYNEGALTLTNNTFTNNTATNNGGAIYNNNELTLTNNTFTGNTANNHFGGAIYSEGGLSTANINNSTFTGNTASDRGGAIYSSEGTLNITNSTFTQNNSIDTAGIIYNSGYSTMINDTFTQNTGEAIWNDQAGDLNINNSTFTQNTANDWGGGAICNDGQLTVTNSTFISNAAINNPGGAIYNDGTANVNFNRIIGNTASQGNAIYNDGGTIDATLNWWGTNNDPNITGDIVNNDGGCSYDPWIILTISANPTTINIGGTSNITADLLHDNHGIYHDPANGLVPYTGLVNFSTTLGTTKIAT